MQAKFLILKGGVVVLHFCFLALDRTPLAVDMRIVVLRSRVGVGRRHVLVLVLGVAFYYVTELRRQLSGESEFLSTDGRPTIVFLRTRVFLVILGVPSLEWLHVGIYDLVGRIAGDGWRVVRIGSRRGI